VNGKVISRYSDDCWEMCTPAESQDTTEIVFAVPRIANAVILGVVGEEFLKFLTCDAEN